MQKNKITIAIPTNRGVKAKTVKALLDLVSNSRDFDIQVIVAEEGYTIAENRMYCIVQALKNESKHILFIDDDMVFPENTLRKLVSNEKDVCGVNAHSRSLPIRSTVELLNEKEISLEDQLMGKTLPEGLFECKAVGGGILLIDLKVFDKLEKPWFGFKTHKTGYTIMGEDSWFCEKVREAGYKIWCDNTLKIGHLGEYTY